MPHCADHLAGRPAPRFLQYQVCDECEATFIYRQKKGIKSRMTATRANRKTARINGKEPTQMMRRNGFACQLLKRDPWFRPHNLTPKKTRCRRCGRKGARKVA